MEQRDIPRILEIERASFLTPWTEGMFRSQIRFKDHAINIVLVDGGALIGYAAAWIVYDEIHLLSIAVEPEKRRQGLGREMLESLMATGKAGGGERVILEVREGNGAARSFYRAFGFCEVGKRRGYYSDTGEDAVIMECRLVD